MEERTGRDRSGECCEARGWLPREWDERAGEHFRIDSPGPLRVAIDGEPAVLESPLELEIEPRALRVLLPRAPGGED